MSSDSKSDDDYGLNIDLDDKCENLQNAYNRLYQLSEELTKNNYKVEQKDELACERKIQN